MGHKFYAYGITPIVTVFIAAASILLDKTPMIIPMLVSGLLFMLTATLKSRYGVLRYCQPVTLGLFHYFTHLNWTEILYLILISLVVRKHHRSYVSFLFTGILVLEYTVIRLTYMPHTTYNMVVSLFDFLAVYLVVVVFQYFLHSEQLAKRLQEQTNYLTTHDPLTGLLNYDCFLKAIQDLVDQDREFALITLDLQDFKSYHTPNIHNGNEIMINMSSKLKKTFKDSLAMSRYAGDRFAVAVPQKDNLLAEVDRLMDSNHFGFFVTYAVSNYPQEAATAAVLISMAEDRLFQNKRNGWLLREEIRFQEEKLRMVGELAAGMAHEIRNPLTTIKGFMQISKNNDYTMKPWFDLVMSEITRMSELTAEFLQFAKPHISNMKPELVQSCIDRVLYLTESEAALLGHLIHHERSDEPLQVLVDKDKLVQVLLNLIRNSFEAMKESGSVHIRLRGDTKHCFIEIEDTGSGMTQEQMEKIFTPFFTTKESGTGLGLSICKKIIQDHGGSLDARSVLDQGSSFTVKLPLLTEMPVQADADDNTQKTDQGISLIGR
ncbi:ATP-binding protein [Cohnella candidum]|uniref:ATP-binding protein n=1 Tax=Cohnella candidum TaxID=2674991 RepID=UPI001F14BA5B|nr:ATP-binding protein [Cohnella candidum]